MSEKKRILSGIQSSGALHIGNYFGAIKQYIELQDEGDGLYFIANYHSITSVQDKDKLRKLTQNAVLDLLALGLDPEKATLFRQTDVPQVTELAWILGCVTTKGLLDRATSYKDKIQRGLTPNVGLYTYPVLMAADILLPRADLVPVGKDQQQHLEMTRDIAGYFNETYNVDLFPLPEAKLNEYKIVIGTSKNEDGSFQKMSKSYNNTIDIFSEGKALKKAVMSIQTDSTPLEEPKNPEKCIVYNLYSLFSTKDEQTEMAENYRAGNYGYGTAKKELLQKINDLFEPSREKRKLLCNDPDFIEDILQSGAKRVRELGAETMDIVRMAVGIG
ncbi:MAG: tryptophan--tRNA ligase [Candidatus Electryonea clarkiae]|nr:tryptophan--tRNA ligase [Candidatus Electryonea clarkiae]MDP8287474.1 tryptophan--tRNA ligase [Candidatus Electryonea clarkiae]